MKGFWPTLILMTLKVQGDNSKSTKEELNIGELIDDALYALNVLDPIVLKKCTKLRNTVFLGVSVHGLRNLRRTTNLTIAFFEGSIILINYFEVQGLVFDFEFWLSDYRRWRSACSVKLPTVSGYFEIKHNHTGELQKLEIAELERKRIDFSCEKELPDDVTKKIGEGLKLAMYAERIKIENAVKWYAKFALKHLHIRKVMYRRFCKIGIPRYCDPGIVWQP